MPTPAELADAYIKGAAEIRAATAGITQEMAVKHPVPGKWSTLELAAHVADFEPIFVERMKRIIAMDQPTLLGADENDFLKSLFYMDRNLEEELHVIEATRAQMARIIRMLSPEDLKRTGQHSARGPMTLEEVITSATRHLAHHVSFMPEKRQALGLKT